MYEHPEPGGLNRARGRRLNEVRREAGPTHSQLAARLRGTASVVQNGHVVQTFTRGTGPAKTTFWTGYWSAAGSQSCLATCGRRPRVASRTPKSSAP